MSFTNSTPNYGLPQWIADDHPKYLTDINNAFSTIDTQLKNANDTANTAADNATSALSIAGQAATTAEGAATVAGQAAALAQSVNELVGTLNAKMGTTSIATIGDGTVTGAIDELNNIKFGGISSVSTLYEESLTDHVQKNLEFTTNEENEVLSINTGNGANSDCTRANLDIYINNNLIFSGTNTGINNSYASVYVMTPAIKKGSTIKIQSNCYFSAGTASVIVKKCL